MPVQLILYVFGFILIWFGAGLVVRNVEKLSHALKMSSFAISFLVLGFFTSISELSVGLNAVIQQDPEIYVGNLIGASIVLFMLIIPLLAIIGNKIHIQKGFTGLSLPLSLIVIGAPVIFAMDGVIERRDGVICMLLYLVLVLFVQTKQGVVEKLSQIVKMKKSILGKELFYILVGVGVIFFASTIVVDQTEYLAQLLGVSPFLISLLIVAIGTNVPEIAVAFRSIFSHNNQVAFGDYVGSASFNTFLFGFLSFLIGTEVRLTNSYLVSLIFLLVGLMLFYIFAKTKNTISRKEGVFILLVYLLFLLSEYYLHVNQLKIRLF